MIEKIPTKAPMKLAAFAMAVLTIGTSMAGPWRRYEIYEPKVETGYIYNGAKGKLKYNHCAATAWFKDRWFALWNANTAPYEGKPSQPVVLATSRDFKNWSEPIEPFNDPKYCTNPLTLGKGRQWQPTLGVVEGQLWCVWNQSSGGDRGCYVSRLAGPDGKWTNQNIDVGDEAVIGGIRYDRFFPTQNLCVLSTGRVLAPLTIRGPRYEVKQQIKDWRRRMKLDTVLYTDDAGKTWHLSPGTTIPGKPWACWEPTVWETPDGLVHMIGRNNNWADVRKGGDPATQMMTRSISRDHGVTWTPHEFIPVETISSRAHVLPAAGDRFVMAMNDWRKGVCPMDRQNGALWFNRGGGSDFAPGINFSGLDTRVAYPQMWITDNAAHIAYTRQGAPSSIRYSRVSPLPDPSRYYLFPRSNTPRAATPAIEDGALRFGQTQRIETRWAKRDNRDMSVGMWVRVSRSGVLLDARKPGAGLLFHFKPTDKGASPSAFMSTKERDVVSDLAAPMGHWCYLGLSIDNRAGKVHYFVDGAMDTKTFTAPAKLAGDTVFFGYKRFEGSRCPGLSGHMRWAAIYDGVCLSPAQHRAAFNALAKALGKNELPDAEPLPKPSFELDPSKPNWRRRLVTLKDETMRVRRVEREGKTLARFNGEASASIDLDRNRPAEGDVVEFEFAFRLDASLPANRQIVLCTTGGGDRPLRIVVDGRQADSVQVRVDGKLTPIAAFDPNGWTRVHMRILATACTVTVGDGDPISVAFPTQSTWLFLGQGYLEGLVPANLGFSVDTASVRSRVVRP